MDIGTIFGVIGTILKVVGIVLIACVLVALIVFVLSVILGAVAWINRIRAIIRFAMDRLIHSKYATIEDPTTQRMITYRMKAASADRESDARSVYRELVAYLNDPTSKRSKHLVYVNKRWQPKDD
jgi:Na+-transporting NADH:ubiquinone oxidoreductase subunit NqrC